MLHLIRTLWGLPASLWQRVCCGVLQPASSRSGRACPAGEAGQGTLRWRHGRAASSLQAAGCAATSATPVRFCRWGRAFCWDPLAGWAGRQWVVVLAVLEVCIFPSGWMLHGHIPKRSSSGGVSFPGGVFNCLSEAQQGCLSPAGSNMCHASSCRLVNLYFWDCQVAWNVLLCRLAEGHICHTSRMRSPCALAQARRAL